MSEIARAGGQESYADLVTQGIKEMRDPKRPDTQRIQEEAQWMAKKEIQYDGKNYSGDDASSIVGRRTQETNKNVRERFELAVKENSAAGLAGTLWENWAAEDCQALLEAVGSLKKEMKLENDTPRLDAPSYEARLIQLEEFFEENKTNADAGKVLGRALDKLTNLVAILKKILSKDPSAVYFSKRYEGWTEEQVQEFAGVAKELLDELTDYADNIPDEY